MSKRIKFSIGNVRRGYKSVEIFVDGTKVEYKILRNELKIVDKNQAVVVNVDEDWLDDLSALNIFTWEKSYRGEEISDGVQWSLTFQDGDKIYRGGGMDAYPDDWDCFLDCLDALIPEMKFIDGGRIDGIELRLMHVTDESTEIFEELSLTRGGETLTIKKSSSAHTYRLGTDGTKNFLDVCQKYFDGLEIQIIENARTELHGTLNHHDETATEFGAEFSERAMGGIVQFAEKIHMFAADLSADIFSPEIVNVGNDNAKIILCKVQFNGNYKAYTYRAEDETFAVGDIVDVPVGRNNDTAQARIVEIGYFDEYEMPFPLEKIKTIIGKHIQNSWENY